MKWIGKIIGSNVTVVGDNFAEVAETIIKLKKNADRVSVKYTRV